jgi:hypothetical protein
MGSGTSKNNSENTTYQNTIPNPVKVIVVPDVYSKEYVANERIKQEIERKKWQLERVKEEKLKDLVYCKETIEKFNDIILRKDSVELTVSEKRLGAIDCIVERTRKAGFTDTHKTETWHGEECLQNFGSYSNDTCCEKVHPVKITFERK